MADTLELFCLVSSADSVDDLKNLIKPKKTPRFDDIAADEITLWSVSIPVVPAKKHDPVLLNSLDSKDELLPTSDLSEVFSEGAPRKTIHIIVQRPPR
ncbi:hypothetical protein BGX26_007981, partial [Mortierella sp. AD094]